MKRIIHIILFVLFSAAAIFSPAVVTANNAECAGLTPGECLLYHYINDARKAPLKTAESFGLNRHQILSEHKESAEILQKGLPALRLNKKLGLAANRHADDITDDKYNTDNNALRESRLLSEGYIPTASRNMVGVLTFNNYMKETDSAALLFQNLFIEELKLPASQWRILNADVREIGLVIRAKKITVSGVHKNAYIAVCELAASEIPTREMEKLIVQLINEARVNPVRAYLNAGFDEEWISTRLPENRRTVSSGLAPLAWDDALSASAKWHIEDMLEKVYWSPVSPDNTRPIDRAAEFGYEADQAQEILYAAVTDSYDLGTALTQMWRAILEDAASDDAFNIFDPGMTQIGAGLTAAPFHQDGGNRIIYILVLDFARPVVPKGFIVGTVYKDANDNQLYDIGEGIAGATVTVRSLTTDETSEFQTGAFGEYQIKFPAFFNELVVTDESRRIASSFYFIGIRENVHINIPVFKDEFGD